MAPEGRPSFTPGLLTESGAHASLHPRALRPPRALRRNADALLRGRLQASRHLQSGRGSGPVRRAYPRRRQGRPNHLCPRLHRRGLQQRRQLRAADRHHRAGAGRCAERRVRGGAIMRRHHRRAPGQVRLAGNPVQHVPRHGRLFVPCPSAGFGARGAHDHERQALHGRRAVRSRHRRRSGGRRRGTPCGGKSHPAQHQAAQFAQRDFPHAPPGQCDRLLGIE